MAHPFLDIIQQINENAPDVEELGGGQPEVELPFGFVQIFGPRPEVKDFLGTRNPSRSHSIAARLWDQDLKYFKQVGFPLAAEPEFVPLSQYNLASGVFRHWDMGTPYLYKGRYGWKAQFPDSLLPDFEADAHAAMFLTHHIVSQYQIKLYLDGDVDNDPRKKHPFVPPFLLSESGKSESSKKKKRRRRRRG